MRKLKGERIMSNVRWTEEQESAITSRGRNLLLSAAAGSGKTAVLVERIIRMVCDVEHPVNITSLLVLTFTKAAAAEMRTRITDALTRVLENAEKEGKEALSSHVSHQLALMGSAHISTIDSFCQTLIKQYFYRIPLDPRYRIESDSEVLYLMKQDGLSDVLLRWYEKKEPDFIKLADMLASRYQDGQLRQIIMKLDSFSQSMAFPEIWLSHLADAYELTPDTTLSDLDWTDILLQDARIQVTSWCDNYRLLFDALQPYASQLQKYIEPLTQEYTQLNLLAESSTWHDWQTRIQSVSFTPRLPAIRLGKMDNPDEIKNIKDSVSDARTKIKKAFTSLQSFFSIPEKAWISQMKETAPLIRVLARLTQDFHDAYMQKKQEEGILEFSDTEHYALTLLVDQKASGFTPSRAQLFPSITALELRKNYTEVMIDEYQDTNNVQETITALLSSGHNRFMVGDIKQSIYRFRLADPTIFYDKYKDYVAETDSQNLRIDLNRNFRSDPSILYGINFIFRQIMFEDSLELNYGKSEALYPGRSTCTDKTYVGGTIDIDILEKPATKDMDESEADEMQDVQRIELEGVHIAHRIKDMLTRGLTIRNKTGEIQPVSYKDIVILMRSISTKAGYLVRTLQNAGIPAICDQSDDFLETMEVRHLWSLLQILNNPRWDIPMTAILRSSLVGLDEQDLAHLALARDSMQSQVSPCLFDVIIKAESPLPSVKQEKVATFLKLFNKWRSLSRRNGVAPLLRTILDDTEYLPYIAALPEGSLRAAHVEAFYQKALAWDNSRNNGLYGFLDTLHRLSKERKKLSASSVQTETDAVQIMTIHKSKGLEFPVVFLADAACQFNTDDLHQSALLHKTEGIGFQYFDEEHKLRWPTLYWYLLKHTMQRENLSEEARLLYVAMTRARDKLIITGTVKDVKNTMKKWSIPLYARTEVPHAGYHRMPLHTITSATCYMDWIVPAAAVSRSMSAFWDIISSIPIYEDESDTPPQFAIHIISPEDLLPELISDDSHEKDDAKDIDAMLKDYLSRSGPVPPWTENTLSWKYPHPGSISTPAKITATAAARMLFEQNEEEPQSVVLTEELTEEETYLPSGFTEEPAFLAKDRLGTHGAAYGTLMHKVMQYLDFKTDYPSSDFLREEIHTLHERNILTDDEEKAILSRSGFHSPVQDILAFLHGPLGKMARASLVRKELPFSILLPAQLFYESCEPEENIFLQGVIDCLLEQDDQLIIIDYKTDFARTEEELIAHYAVQLNLYAYAIQRIYAMPVSHMYLWSFRLKKAIPIPFHSHSLHTI